MTIITKKRNNKNNKNKTRKQKQKRKIQTKYTGGAKIGKGSFGCVVKPAIKCKPLQSNKNLISKIILNADSKDYKKELKILKFIRSIDPSNKYLISFIDDCELDKNSAFSRKEKDVIKVKYDYELNPGTSKSGSSNFSIMDDNFNSVQSIEGKKKIEKEYCLVDPRPQYKYRNQIQVYGGSKIMPVLKNPHQYNIDYNLMKTHYKYIIFNLLKGCKRMHSNEFVHRDIKFDNLVYTIINKKPIFRYIDFNLGNLFKNNSKKYLSINGTPSYIPIDYHLYYLINTYYNKGNNLKDEIIINDIINKIIDKFIDHIDIVIEDLDSRLDPVLEGPVVLTEKDGKRKLRRKNPTGKKPKLPYLAITTNTIYRLYSYYSNIIMGDNDFKELFCFKKYTGIVYKTDIFALGIILGLMQELLEINDANLSNLIKHMTYRESKKRYNIIQCLNHPFCKSIKH
jgi:serine/threonine protein kinase